MLYQRPLTDRRPYPPGTVVIVCAACGYGPSGHAGDNLECFSLRRHFRRHGQLDSLR